MGKDYNMFDRYYLLTIADSETGESYTYDSETSPIKLTFSIKITMLEQANSCNLSVWNLGKNVINSLETHKCAVMLSAGYGLHKGIIFGGYVLFASTSKDGGNFKTDIEAYDMVGYETDSDYAGNIALNYSSEVTWKKVIEDINYLTSIAFIDETGGLLDNTTIRSGFAFVGKVSTLLSQCCAACKATWRGNGTEAQNGYDTGAIIISPKNIKIDAEGAFVLSASSGLIGFPKRVKLQNYTDDGVVYTGWEVEYLLNPAIKVGSTVKLQSQMASGFFIASMIGMSGDSYGETWKCTARLLAKEDYIRSQNDGSDEGNAKFEVDERLRMALRLFPHSS